MSSVKNKRDLAYHHMHEDLHQNKGCDPAYTDAQT